MNHEASPTSNYYSTDEMVAIIGKDPAGVKLLSAYFQKVVIKTIKTATGKFLGATRLQPGESNLVTELGIVKIDFSMVADEMNYQCLDGCKGYEDGGLPILDLSKDSCNPDLFVTQLTSRVRLLQNANPGFTIRISEMENDKVMVAGFRKRTEEELHEKTKKYVIGCLRAYVNRG